MSRQVARLHGAAELTVGTRFRIPSSLDDAVLRMSGLGELLVATEWARAALVATYVRLGGFGSGEAVNSDHLVSAREFARLGIYGFTSHVSVLRYVRAWMDHVGKRPQPGQQVTLPTAEFPKTAHEAEHDDPQPEEVILETPEAGESDDAVISGTVRGDGVAESSEGGAERQRPQKQGAGGSAVERKPRGLLPQGTTKGSRETLGDEFGTPQDLYEKLHAMFHFTLDVAASPLNTKCPQFFDKAMDGLRQEWDGRVWLNAPYSDLEPWVVKAILSAEQKVEVVGLFPCSLGAAWFRDMLSRSCELWLVMRRLSFEGAPSQALFSSVVVIFGRQPRIRCWDPQTGEFWPDAPGDD
jgi:phage N-6-adenine-methyltransferase